MSCCKKVKQIVQGYTRLVTGQKHLDTDQRIKICRSCDQAYWIRKKIFCSICKCYVPAKARADDGHCPLNKWPDETEKKDENIKSA